MGSTRVDASPQLAYPDLMCGGALVVVGGLPAVGKTTLSRRIASRLGAVYLRIDSIEQAMRNSGITQPIHGAGYTTAHAVADDNLELGRTVVAECVNPWMLTRNAWRTLAQTRGAPCVEVEIVCSDPQEHRRRIENRHSDVPGLVLPTWQDVLDRDYRPWERERLVVDTAGRDPEACVMEILDACRNLGLPA